MQFECSVSARGGRASWDGERISFFADGDAEDAFLSLCFSFPAWERDAYVFLPACAYDGNRMEKRYGAYPFSYQPSDLSEKGTPVISDIPALSPDGSGKIEVTAADLSVPCFGIFYREKREALLVFTEQACKGKTIGFSVERGRVEIQLPAMREYTYRMGNSAHPSNDSGFSVRAGERIASRIRILSFPCDSLPAFFKAFFENRRCLLSDAPATLAYTPDLLASLEAHMNRDCFSGEYYAEMHKNFKCGWVGGPLTALALFGCGTALSRERAERTLDFMCAHTSAEGFFDSFFSDGRILYDGGQVPHMEKAMLVRKNGDGLAALCKVLLRYKEKEAWRRAARKCADGFLRILARYGDFGHYVNIENGASVVGGTASGASVVGALALAFRCFGEEKYLAGAQAAGEKYYRDFEARGMTYGGPGDALCAPDSESAYAMVESMVLLYEADKNEKWLAYAKNCLYYLSSWVMPYAFSFPEESEFARLSVNTVGSVFANAQNKHSSPGLCTASGDAIYRLFRYTGDEKILSLLLDIVSFMPQCVSTDKRPIYSHDVPKKRLSDGWICERVNTSDWEGENFVGGVFAYPCWPATSMLLTYSELISDENFLSDIKILSDKEKPYAG